MVLHICFHYPSNTLHIQSIRDDQEFVALSSNQKNRARVGRRKSLASQRRLSTSKLSAGKIELAEVNKISEQEKDRMINILMVKTGRFIISFILALTNTRPKSMSPAYSSKSHKQSQIGKSRGLSMSTFLHIYLSNLKTRIL